MKKLPHILLLLLTMTLVPGGLYGQDILIKGTVRDSLQTVPYATVYLKGHPGKGVLSSPDGLFNLRVTPAMLPDTLVVSFVGYHTAHTPLFPGQDTLALDITLRQNVIQLQDAVVTAKARRKYKVNTADIIERVKQQMESDFAHIEAIYRVQTNTSISSSDKILAYQENLVDTYDPGTGKKDMTHRLKTKVYFDPRAYDRMQQVDTLRNIDPTVNIKGLTVTEGMIRGYLKEKPQKWAYVGQVDGEIILTYYDIIRFLKMFRFGQQCVLYVDAQTYSIKRAEAIMAVYVNIPFGKRLPDQFVPFMNILNVSDREFDHFRLKKVEGEFRMSSHFVKRGDSVYRGDSYSHGEATISGGNKKNALYIGLKSDTKILGLSTENIIPITEEQTREKPQLTIVDDL